MRAAFFKILGGKKFNVEVFCHNYAPLCLDLSHKISVEYAEEKMLKKNSSRG